MKKASLSKCTCDRCQNITIMTGLLEQLIITKERFNNLYDMNMSPDFGNVLIVREALKCINNSVFTGEISFLTSPEQDIEPPTDQ